MWQDVEVSAADIQKDKDETIRKRMVEQDQNVKPEKPVKRPRAAKSANESNGDATEKDSRKVANPGKES